MKNFYLTIGVKYINEPHPLNIHPDQYVKILIQVDRLIRRYAFKTCGQTWAFIYSEDEFHPEYYPKGEAFSICFPSFRTDVTGISSVGQNKWL